MNVHDASAALDVLIARKQWGELTDERFREALLDLRTTLNSQHDPKCRMWILPVIEEMIAACDSVQV